MGRIWRVFTTLAVFTLLSGCSTDDAARSSGGSTNTVATTTTSERPAVVADTAGTWTYDRPVDWRVDHYRYCDTVGSLVSNRPGPRRNDPPRFCSSGWDLSQAPPDLVAIDLHRLDKAPNLPPPAADTPRPLRLEDLQVSEYLGFQQYAANVVAQSNQFCVVQAWIGPAASADDIEALRQLIQSITWPD